jgi:monooxygenase
MSTESLDMLIVGAGISGIGVAYHYQKHFPNKSWQIIESREALGGTWDLFRYPGIRSDSDMYTFGYQFKPWTSNKAISPGEDILEYLNETVREFGIDKNIRFGKRLVSADWDGDAAVWRCGLKDMATGELVTLSSRFLFMCSGYYNYDEGYEPGFPGREAFQGPVIHPQHWPEDLDIAGKRIIIIGSGATAITLAPTLAEGGATVTLLQRSPTYVISRPAEDPLANRLRKFLPASWTHGIVRWKNILMQMFLYQLSQRRPQVVKGLLLKGIRAQLGPDYDVKKHFKPSYNPWDQRICLVPDGDFFKAIRSGGVTMVTDHIDTFTPEGIRLQSGEQLQADIIISATGLKMELMAGVSVSVNQKPIRLSELVNYKGVMVSGLPNFAVSMGYTNASWTLKTDLVGKYVCRLIRYMDKKSFRSVCPVLPEEGLETIPIVDLQAGYIQRALDSLPRQGKTMPWRLHMNYLLDSWALSRVTRDGLQFEHEKKNGSTEPAMSVERISSAK